MVDNLGTWNHVRFASVMKQFTKATGGSIDQPLNSIVLPNISGTIQRVSANLNILSLNAVNDLIVRLEGLQAIQVKESVSGSFSSCVDLVDNGLETKVSGAGSYRITGSADVKGEVSAFNKTYDFQWQNLDFEGDDVDITVVVELDIWFTIDSGVEDKVDIIDGIVDDIKGSIIVGSGTVQADGTTTVFETDLTENDDYWNNLQILFLTAVNNARQARRITDFANVNGVITVVEAMNGIAKSGDTFIIIGRYTGAGSSLTEAGIADAVWDEQKAGHVAVDSFGKILQEVETDTSDMRPRIIAIELDTDEIQGKLPINNFMGSSVKTDKDDEIDDIKIAVETDIPAQLVVIENHLNAIDDYFVLEDDTPQIIIKPTLINRIETTTGDPIDDVQTEIPLFSTTLWPAKGYVKIDSEYIWYGSIEDNTLKDCTRGELGSVAASHNNESSVYETKIFSISMELFPFQRSGDGFTLDSAPTLKIYRGELLNVLELNTTLPLLGATSKRYAQLIIIDSSMLKGPRLAIVNYIKDSYSRNIYRYMEYIDEPASQDLVAGQGTILPNALRFDEEGWIDTSGIKHDWTDEMAGSINDDHGRPLTGVQVKAFLRSPVDDEVLYAREPWYDKTTELGQYRGALVAGTYLFIFYLDGKKWKEAERTLG